MRLEGKVAVVTGGGSGIGRAIALGMGREGASVVVADMNAERAAAAVKDIADAGGKALAVKTDVAEKEEVDAMVKAACDTFGTVDILVCAAAVKEKVPMLECTLEQWDRMLAVNLRGVMLCTQAAGRVMSEKNSGKIVILSSLAAIRGRGQQQAYCASKGALLAFVKSAAKQLGEYNITVNAIAPGIIDTENPEPLNDREEKIEHIPMKRVGTPEDIVGPAIFLSSEDSAYVSGITMLVDGAVSVRLTGADS